MPTTNFPGGLDAGATSVDSLAVSGAAAISGTLTLDLTGIPVYADQAAASAALGAGQVFRITTTGALAITLA